MKFSTSSSEITQQTFQHQFNVVFRLVWRRNVTQRQINVETTLYMSTLKSTTQNNVETKLCFSTLNWTTLGNVETTVRIWPFKKKYKPRFKAKVIFLNFKKYVGLNIFLHFFPILREICKRTFAEPQKILKHRIYWITKSIFKPSHFVKCQLVFNFKRQVQAHYDYRSFNLYVSFKCVRKL